MLKNLEKEKQIKNIKSKFDINVLPNELKNNINNLFIQYLDDRSNILFDILYWQIRSNLNYYEIEKIISKDLANIIRSEIKCLF